MLILQFEFDTRILNIEKEPKRGSFSMLTSHVFPTQTKRAINHMLRMMALTIYAPSRNARISALVFELFVKASNGILQYFQICSEGCPEAAKWSDLTQDVADTEQSDSLVQERNRGCADQYEEYEDLAYQ